MPPPFPLFAPIFQGSAIRLCFGAVFLTLIVAACVSDVRRRRIPNTLVVALMVGGVVFSVWARGLGAGMGQAFGGIATGLAIWLVFYAVGVLGAGDVKFFAAASAWIGPALSWRASLLSAAVGGVLAVVFLTGSAKLGATVRRLALAPFLRRLDVAKVSELSAEESRRQLPYGVAMGIGLTIIAMFPGILG